MERISGSEIANNIRAERNRVHMTQEETAQRLGVSLRTYLTYEDDARNVKATMLYMLSLIFKCSIDSFYVQSKFTYREYTKKSHENSTIERIPQKNDEGE